MLGWRNRCPVGGIVRGVAQTRCRRVARVSPLLGLFTGSSAVKVTSVELSMALNSYRKCGQPVRPAPEKCPHRGATRAELRGAARPDAADLPLGMGRALPQKSCGMSGISHYTPSYRHGETARRGCRRVTSARAPSADRSSNAATNSGRNAFRPFARAPQLAAGSTSSGTTSTCVAIARSEASASASRYALRRGPRSRRSSTLPTLIHR